MRFERACGVLLHPTSLPGPYGIGDLGPEAHRYLEWLAGAGVRWWQVLSLNAPGGGNSPYAARSAFAGNPLLVSPEFLCEDDLLAPSDLAALPRLRPAPVDFQHAIPLKRQVLRQAFARFRRAPGALAAAFEAFRAESEHWLPDFAVYEALKEQHGDAAWTDWPEEYGQRREPALGHWRAKNRDDIEFQEFCQFLFDRQWQRLRARGRELNIRILGDVPIYMAEDSADVWARRELFLLDERGRPAVVAGVPPDYFNENGQLWGNPLYDWELMASRGFEWWVRRLEHALRYCDVVRLDHFRGFAAFWEVQAGSTSARDGRWVPGPGSELFRALEAQLGRLPLVAEDLGEITDDVLALRDEFDLTGMAVLQFAFSPHDRSKFLPYEHARNLLVYTGTHDNNTTRGWYEEEASEEVRDFVRRYAATSGEEIHWDLIRLALGSVADLAMVPHQDVAGLGSRYRMNRPGEEEGNWAFRLEDGMLDRRYRDRLAELIWLYGR
ncbi:MAG: 4-alpha-glucanotransferase [Acidobacteria bacterium]|nr:4-alpha-glucanotransferase [Acidobacteriota bacterium]